MRGCAQSARQHACGLEAVFRRGKHASTVVKVIGKVVDGKTMAGGAHRAHPDQRHLAHAVPAQPLAGGVVQHQPQAATWAILQKEDHCLQMRGWAEDGSCIAAGWRALVPARAHDLRRSAAVEARLPPTCRRSAPSCSPACCVASRRPPAVGVGMGHAHEPSVARRGFCCGRERSSDFSEFLADATEAGGSRKK